MAKSTGECGVWGEEKGCPLGVWYRPQISQRLYSQPAPQERERLESDKRRPVEELPNRIIWPIFCDGLSESRLNARDGLKLLMGRSVHIDHNLRLLLRLSPDSTPTGIGDRCGSGYRESPLEGVQ